jgi:hypothetical protein
MADPLENDHDLQRGAMLAEGGCVAAAFAARSSGEPFVDRRGFWEWTRRLAL